MNNSIVDFLNSQGKASDFTSRKTLADANGIIGYVGSADQNIKLLNSLKSSTPVQPPTPTGTGAITVDQLKKETAINVPPPAADTTNYTGLALASSDSINKTFETLNKQYTDAVTKQSQDAKDISKSMELLLNKGTDTALANETAGVGKTTEELNTFLTQLGEINAQSTALGREAQTIPLALQEKVAGQGVTDAGLAPETAGELRKNAIKQLTLAQRADIVGAAATGSYNKLQLAKEKAQQIVDLKYKPIEDNLNVRLKQYELNKDFLTSIDKKRSEALEAKLNQEKNILEYYKTTEKAKSDLIIKAAPFAPANLLERAAKAPDAQSAAIILGSYAGDYLATEKTKQEIIKLQIENGTYNMNDVSSVGVVSKDNGFSLQDFKRGIGMLESSQNYSAIGKIMETGAYKGDRAYGKYQVMGKNIPSWTKQALGYSLTPQQFLSNPDAQEKVFEYQSELNYAKYGNWDDVAAVWFSGQPLTGNNASDGQTNVPDYVKKMRKFMGVTEPTQVKIEGYSDRVISNLKMGKIVGGQLVSASTGLEPKNVPAGDVTSLAAGRDLVAKLDKYKQVFTDLQNEGVTGITGTGVIKGTKNAIFPSENATRLKGLRTEITDLISRARSGAALTQFEFDVYESKLPSSWSSDTLFGNPIVDIDTFRNSLNGTVNSKMQTYGLQFAPTLDELYFKQMEGVRTGATVTESPSNYGGYNL